ncbi:MAG: galactonate dehydratase [Candidatus Accumulibacter sp.]|jgi:galactonate dehydratase|nr:galactonate dehydratase [Accumulibacter sp.]
MIIEKLDLYKLPPRWVFLKITTRSGYTGWGEPLVEGKADSVMAAVRDMQAFLIGRDAGRIEDIFQTLSKGGFYRGGVIMMSAISGIEQALWDIKGKHYGAPVHQLLGGAVRDRMRIYAWVGGDVPEETARQAAERMEHGFTAVKMNLSGQLDWHVSERKIKEIKAAVGQVRAAIGDANDLAIDFHGRVHKNMAKRLVREMEEFAPMFLEEALLPEHSDQYAALARYTHTPLAAGERLVGRREFKPLIADGGLDILQPDLSHVGGIWEAKKIAAWAEASDMAVALHAPLGPIAFAAALQFDFCTHNALIQETSMGIHYHGGDIDLLTYVANKDDFKTVSGYIRRNEKPGLGVEIDEAAVAELSKTGHDWKNPVWRNEDGSFTEW